MPEAQNKVREQLAQQFIQSLNEGQLPWEACWHVSSPQNAVTGKRYRGVNNLLLGLMSDVRGWSDPRWCTYRQAQEKGWQVVKGSKGLPVEYWAYYDRNDKKLLSWKDANALIRNAPDYAARYLQLRCRVYTVFHASMIEGIPEYAPPEARTNIDTIRSQRDTLIRNMGITYREEGERAFYRPSTDTVTLPPEGSFFDTYSYLCTFLHECGHATGHPSRLNRDLSDSFGSESYAREELRAEIASAFVSQEIGLALTPEQLAQHFDSHKAYIQSWAKHITDAPEELFKAIKDAQTISDYLIAQGEFLREQGQEETVPSYTGRDTLRLSGDPVERARQLGMSEEQIALFDKPNLSREQKEALAYGLRTGCSESYIQDMAAHPELPPEKMLDGIQHSTPVEELAQDIQQEDARQSLEPDHPDYD